jgi:hypothetical protein
MASASYTISHGQAQVNALDAAEARYAVWGVAA